MEKQGTNEPPNVLRIKNGKLFCADGQKLGVYLKQWAKETGIDEETPINLIPRKTFIEIVKQNSELRQPVYCSYCKKHQSQVTFVIAGAYGFICNECVDVCKEIIDEKLNEVVKAPGDVKS